MPRVIGQTAYGNSVLQDDGTVVFLPPWADAGGFGAGAPAQSDLAGMAPDAPLNPPVPAPDAIAPDGSALAPPAVAPAPPLDVTQPQKVIEPPPSNVLGFPDGSPSASTAADIAPGPPVIAAPQPAVETPPVAPPVPAPEPPPPPPQTPVEQAAQAEVDKAAIAQAKSAEDVRVYNEATAAEQSALDNVRLERENYARQFESTRSAYEMATKEAAKFDARVPEDTTGTKFSKLIFLALGGLGQVLQRQGGPNPVMAILDAAVEREAQARLKRYQQLQAKAGGLKAGMDAIADMAKTPEGYLNGVRASIRARLTTEIEKNAATFAGPTALATANAVNADNLAKAEKAAADAARADTEVALKAQKQAADEKQAATDAALRKSQIGLGYAELGEKKREFTASITYKAAQDAVENSLKLAGLGQKDGEQNRTSFEREKNEAARASPRFPIVLRDAKGNITGVDRKELVDRGVDGKERPFVYKSEKAAELMAPKVAAFMGLMDSYNRLAELRREYGPELFNRSDAARAMWINYTDSLLVMKDQYGLGVLAGNDENLLKKVRGSSDPTEILDYLDANTESRNLITRKFNNDLRAIGGYAGDRDVTIVDPNEKPSELTETGKKLKGIVADVTPRKGLESVARAIATAAGGKPPVLAKGVAAKVDEIATQAATGDLEARKALAELVRNPATSDRARAMAAKIGLNLSEYGIK